MILFQKLRELLINYLPLITSTHREVMSPTSEMHLPVGGKRLGIMPVHIGNKNSSKLPPVLEKAITTVRGWSGHLNQHFIFLQCVLLRTLMSSVGVGSFLFLKAKEHLQFHGVP